MSYALPLSIFVFIVIVVACAPWRQTDPHHKFMLDTWAHLAVEDKCGVSESEETTNIA